MFDRSQLDAFRDVDGRGGYSRQGGSDVDFDPYPTFASWRQRGDVVATDLHRDLGLDAGLSTVIATGGFAHVDRSLVFSAVSFDAVSMVLRSDRFDNSAHLRAYEPILGRTLITLDGHEHRRKRALVAKVFTRRALEGWNDTVIVPAARRLVQGLEARANANGSADLLQDFILDFPAEVIVAILGLPTDDVRTFTNTALAMITFSNPSLAMEAGTVLHEWIIDLAENARRRSPEPNLLSQLAVAEEDGDRLTSDEISSFLRLLFVGGFETTVKALANLAVGLLTSGQWSLLREQPDLVPAAVEEGLRWQTSVLGVPRVAVEDVEVCGVQIPAGGVVMCFLAAANHDDRRWNRPELFDATRPAVAHVSFGLGAHLCVGLQLARSEMALALRELLRQAPGLALLPDSGDQVRIRGLASRGPTSIPIVVNRDAAWST